MLNKADNCLIGAENLTLSEVDMAAYKLSDNEINLGDDWLVKINPYNDQVKIHIRKFIRYSPGGKLYPTKEGLTFNIDGWSSFSKRWPSIKSAIGLRRKSGSKDQVVEVADEYVIVIQKEKPNGINLLITRNFDGISITLGMAQWAELVKNSKRICEIIYRTQHDLVESKLFAVEKQAHQDKSVEYIYVSDEEEIKDQKEEVKQVIKKEDQSSKDEGKVTPDPWKMEFAVPSAPRKKKPTPRIKSTHVAQEGAIKDEIRSVLEEDIELEHDQPCKGCLYGSGSQQNHSCL